MRQTIKKRSIENDKKNQEAINKLSTSHQTTEILNTVRLKTNFS